MNENTKKDQSGASTQGQWDFWVDRGGTFTDIVARKPDGSLVTHKLLSENPAQYEDAALQGMRDLLGLSPTASLQTGAIRAVKMGTTIATNALLERKGEPTLFLTTQGFADILKIGTQSRPHLFKLAIEKNQVLYTDVAQAPERISVTGEVLKSLDLEATRTQLQAAYNKGLRAVAICFLHGYRYSHHEEQAAVLAQEIGFTQISVSHHVSPLIKFVPRGDTTVVDAYLSPVLKRYVATISKTLIPDENTHQNKGTAPKDGLASPQLMFMQSSGGLTDATLFEGKDAILSGPAGGVVGAVETSAMAGFDHIIGFDMGGTSTDVCHYAGELERSFDTQVAGIRMRAPMMQINTVAAGGGSIVRFDGTRLRVGPESAGAHPGPAAYRNGGPLTVTDANVMVGKLLPEHFPKVFGPTADAPLDDKTTATQFEHLAKTIPGSASAYEIADGFITIAVENMAQAIKKISVLRGYDVTDYTLSCFGGAGGQHACLVADALGMETIYFHPFSGILSAYGMGLADIRALREEAVEQPLTSDNLTHVNQAAQRLTSMSRDDLQQQGVPANKTQTRVHLALRYAGTDTPLQIADPSHQNDMAKFLTEFKAEFERTHQDRFGFSSPGKEIIIEAVIVETIGKDTHVEENIAFPHRPQGGPTKTTRFYSQGGWHTATVMQRAALAPNDTLSGPAIIIEPHATIIVEAGWQASITPLNHLVLRRLTPRPTMHALGTQADPIRLEVFNNLFISIAEQMGFSLEKTAHSVNIKERLDFSCAIFDHAGNLVANAPHVPVHLGSMGASVQAVITNNPNMGPGDVFVLNAPYNGGTHLPDVTVVTPVYDAAGKERLFYAAARGHHADIGGITPGSMPAQSKSVDEEGVLIDNFKLVSNGTFHETEMRKLLTDNPYPARNPDQNLADLRAQIAACEKGAQELRKMVDHYGLETVRAYMDHVQDNAEENVRRVIGVLKNGSFEKTLDDGTTIKVAVTVNTQERTAKIDFTGTSPMQPTNLNAPSSVAYAAVLYVFRCLVDDEIPLNAGCLKPIEIIIPDGSLLSPTYPAAVVGGNVETSQAITDALFGALGIMAGAQGSMNNFTFGNERHQYYETICGGAGAGATFNGADAVHTHMTNSRLTDPEVIEHRFPVRLKHFSIRPQTGGDGAHHGGNGVDRAITFLEDMSVSLLTTHRTVQPLGLAGGENGQSGENLLERTDGSHISLDPAAQVDLKPGETIIIRTPGGGGFGTPK
ncbi:MAG: 5-oxoprolinase (ATP-hydrolyzing) [Parvibaculaceae bacterium]|jgi:5-oxoprolinase (ATP-hydrolysing)